MRNKEGEGGSCHDQVELLNVESRDESCAFCHDAGRGPARFECAGSKRWRQPRTRMEGVVL